MNAPIHIVVEPHVRGWRVRIDGADGTHRRGLVDPLTDPGLAGFSNWHELLHALAPNEDRQLTGQELRVVGARIWEGLVVASGLAAVLDGLGDRVPRRYTLEIDEESDPHLAVLPFELAFAGEGVGYHFKRAHPRAVRVLSQRPARPVRLVAGTRLLVATAASPGQAPDAPELATHAASIAGLAQARGWEVRCLAEATPAALEAALQDPRGTDVLYVVAHGAANPNTFGRLALVGDDLTGSDLKRMLEDTAATARPCRAVLLCACSGALAQPGLRAETTGMAQALAQHAVEAAIGFRARVGVAWALDFMQRLFHHLGHDPDLEGAFAGVRARLRDEEPQWPLLAYYGRPLAPEPAVTRGVASAVVGVPSVDLPAPSPWFTAREAELRRLDELLRSPGAAVIHALEGDGGIGKTELARVVASRYAAERTVVWLDRPDRDPRAALEALLAAGAGENAAAFREVPDDALAALVRTLLAGRGGLLVLDDVADGEPLALVLPGSNWNVLVTTRVEALLPEAARVELGPLAPDDARLLFCWVAWGTEAPPADEAEALEPLLAALGGLPLALELAARSIDQGARVADYHAGLGQDFGPAWADQARVRTVLARILDELGADDRAAFEALGALPVSGADALTVALTLGWPEGRARRALDTLARHRAARYAPQMDRYGLHPLLRDEARVRLKGRPGAWDAAHAGVAEALYRRVRGISAAREGDFTVVITRWERVRDMLRTLDRRPWDDGADGAATIAALAREVGVLEASVRPEVELSSTEVSSHRMFMEVHEVRVSWETQVVSVREDFGRDGGNRGRQ